MNVSILSMNDIPVGDPLAAPIRLVEADHGPLATITMEIREVLHLAKVILWQWKRAVNHRTWEMEPIGIQAILITVA